MELLPLCSNLSTPEIRQKCLEKCSGPGISVINTQCQIECSPLVNCLQDWAKKDCDDMEKIADDYVKKISGDKDKIKKFINQWNKDVKILTTKPDILRLIGEIVGKFRVNLTCLANRITDKLKITDKLNVPDDLDLGLAMGARAIPKSIVYIIVIISMVLISIFVCLPFMRKKPLLNLVPILIVTIGIILIIHFFNYY